MKSPTAMIVAAFLALALAWGATFPLTKIVLPFVDPSQVVLVRVVSGFLSLLLYSSLSGALSFAHLKHWPHFVVMSFLGTTIYYLGYALAAGEMLAGVASVLSGVAPLFVFVLAAIFLPGERLTWIKGIGVALGFAGVALVAAPTAQDFGQTTVLGLVYLLGGALVFSSSYIYARRFLVGLDMKPAALVTYQLGIASLVLLVLVPKSGLASALVQPTVAASLVVGLGVFGTGLAFLLYYFIVQRIGAVSASSATYLPPLVGLVISVVWMGEVVSWTSYVAMALILTGVWCLREVTPQVTKKAAP